MASPEVPANRFSTAADDRGVRSRARKQGRARWHKKVGLTRRALTLVNPKDPRQPLQLPSGEASKRVMRWKVPHEGPVTDADLPKTDKQRHTIPTSEMPSLASLGSLAGPPLGIACSSESSWPPLNLHLLRGLGPAGKNVFPFVVRLCLGLLADCLLFSQNCRLRHLKCEYELAYLEVVNVLIRCPDRR